MWTLKASGIPWLLSLPFSLLLSCGPGTSSLELAKVNIVRELALARDFKDTFPDSVGSFSYYTGEAGPTTWHAKFGVGGRFIVHMGVPVTLDRARLHVLSAGEPEFRVLEVSDIEVLADGRFRVSYASDRKLSTKDWAKLVEANGDLSVIGIDPKANLPIPKFEEYWPID